MVLLEEGIASGVPEMKNEKESRKLRSLKMKTHYDSAQCVTFVADDEILRIQALDDSSSRTLAASSSPASCS